MRNPAAATTTPCCSKVGIKRGPWTPEEDEILSRYINKEGEGRWRTLPKRAGLQRCGKSCRLRWMNYLRPDVKRGRIAPDEEDLILRLHRLLGNRWSLIAGRIPGRTDNEIKNYWNTHLSKKLISQGIDPRNHKPLLNPTSSSSAHIDDNTPPSILSNPSPNYNKGPPRELQEASFMNKSIGIATNSNHQYDHEVAPLMVGEEDGNNYLSRCNEDTTFTSFLDSLINESAFVTYHHQPQPPPPQMPVVSSFWESELIRSTMEDMQNGGFNHHQSS